MAEDLNDLEMRLCSGLFTVELRGLVFSDGRDGFMIRKRITADSATFNHK